MNRFRRSGGRVSLEILCALTISLSLAGAWLQSGAWALLPASLASLVGAIILAADLRGGAAAPVAEPQRIDFDSGLAKGASEVAEEAPAAGAGNEQVPLPEEKPAPKPRATRGKGPGRARKASSKKASAAQAVREEAENPPAAAELTMVTEGLPEVENEPAELFTEEPQHPPVAPLFEPEPFVRQQRAVFGRKAG